ncbi:hypothetical protein ACTM97_08990 [Oliverpabstia intestinalis]|uniref:hypothetical protein n=1 Tax=Oliverpabstia intestinalis TaxID=2606633 RepID=UPI003F88839A
MLRQLFESFYEGNIDKIATRVIANNEGFTYIKNLDGVYEEYLNQKTMLRYLIKSKVNNGKDENAILLDGHKVAACITCAIVKVRLIVNNHVEDSDGNIYSLDKSYRMNEQVALLSGLSCLLEYMAENKEFLYSDELDTNKTKLIFPKTHYVDRSDYLDSLVRALYYSNILSNINPLLLSHIYYMIEEYHRKSVELEIVKRDLDKLKNINIGKS